MLRSHGRYDYSPIARRPDYSWPGGKRLAVHLCLNIEHFAFGEGLGNDYSVPQPQPNVRSYAWRDYGNRVGAWRLLEFANDYDLPYAVLLNSELYDYCPELLAAYAERGDEMVGHGRTNAERQDTMWEEDERRLIAESRDAIIRHAGVKPEGWLGPYLAQSAVTLDLLKEEGFSYVMDWPADDQPFWMTTRAGPILSVPYSIELNDSPALVFRQHSGREFAQMIVDQFDETERERPALSERSESKGMLRLFCTIFVETESQKPIVIGRGGEMIKRIGSEARADLESFFDTRVFHDLRVKVDPDWRDNDRSLDLIGVPRTARRPPRPERRTRRTPPRR